MAGAPGNLVGCTDNMSSMGDIYLSHSNKMLASDASANYR